MKSLDSLRPPPIELFTTPLSTSSLVEKGMWIYHSGEGFMLYVYGVGKKKYGVVAFEEYGSKNFVREGGIRWYTIRGDGVKGPLLRILPPLVYDMWLANNK